MNLVHWLGTFWQGTLLGLSPILASCQLLIFLKFCYQVNILGLRLVFQPSDLTRFGLGLTGVWHIWSVALAVLSLHQNEGGSLPASLDGLLLPLWVRVGKGGIKPSGKSGTHALHLQIMKLMPWPGSFEVPNLSSS